MFFVLTLFCLGHFGYIELNEPIVHPLYYKQVVSLLRCFCIKCYKLLITEDQITLNNLHRFKDIKRFNKILEKLEKIDMCTHCSHPQPDIKHTTVDNVISMVYKDKSRGKISIVLTVDEIKKIFDNISISDVKLLGFNPDLVQPKNLILTVFPVIPTSCRPYVMSDNNICDDDLTIQLVEIIKANNHLEQQDGVPISDTKKQKHLQSLKFRIATFYNNSCLAPDTPVLMWDGTTKRADEVIVGDELIGDDGEMRIVEVTCSGEDEMYEIDNGKGDNYIVNGNHILTLKYTGHNKMFWKNPNDQQKQGCWMVRWFDGKKPRCKYVSVTEEIDKEDSYEQIKEISDNISNDNVFDIKVKDFLKMSDTTKRNLLGFKLFNPINWDYTPIDLDPYILGVWLGDGDSNGYGFTSIDEEIVDYWKKWASENECEVVIRKCKRSEKSDGKKITYYKSQVNDPEIYKPDIKFYLRSIHNKGDDISSWNHLNPLKKLLSQYNLVKNKHIPDKFLYNSKDIRMKVLAGFIDTDGHVCKDGTNITISQTIRRETLMNQTQFLARSLGFSAYISKKDSTWKDSDGNMKSGDELILTISGINVGEIPTLIPKKKCSQPKKRDTSQNGSIKIKPIGIGKYNGFIIDKNHRFLLGDFTVTHNSGKAKHSTNGQH